MENQLLLYYSKYFPADEICSWLSHDSNLVKREFSFTLDRSGSEIYIRYLSFPDSSAFRRELTAKNPVKIDIGAVYNISPSKHNTVEKHRFIPVERELVFDIDLTDYFDVINKSEEDKKSSSKLWTKQTWIFMSTAMKIVSKILTDEFGFVNFFWVFSGRRGVHCWVCDMKARMLTDSSRSALMKRISLIFGEKIDFAAPISPNLLRFKGIIEEAFQNCMLSELGQDLMGSEQIKTRLFNLITFDDPKHKEALMALVKSDDWNEIESFFEKVSRKIRKKGKLKKAEAMKSSALLMKFYCLYPRLDVNVSTHRNHLLKAPFAVHPKTGKVCVPIFDVKNCDSFDPEKVPNLKDLGEIEYDQQLRNSKRQLEAFVAKLKAQSAAEKENIPEPNSW
eukprot:maker-scaffold_15-snap-gene-2.21-mRNA-1 protein AED:0.01 eAED:0.01 QI:86/1/1/1/1/1/2/48/392